MIIITVAQLWVHNFIIWNWRWYLLVKVYIKNSLLLIRIVWSHGMQHTKKWDLQGKIKFEMGMCTVQKPKLSMFCALSQNCTFLNKSKLHEKLKNGIDILVGQVVLELSGMRILLFVAKFECLFSGFFNNILLSCSTVSHARVINQNNILHFLINNSKTARPT